VAPGEATRREDPPGRSVEECQRLHQRRQDRMLRKPSMAWAPAPPRTPQARRQDRPSPARARGNPGPDRGHTERRDRRASAVAAPAPQQGHAAGPGMARPSSETAPNARPAGPPGRDQTAAGIDLPLEAARCRRADRPSSTDPTEPRSPATKRVRSSSPRRTRARIDRSIESAGALASFGAPRLRRSAVSVGTRWEKPATLLRAGTLLGSARGYRRLERIGRS
jgi:hypothetical protein